MTEAKNTEVKEDTKILLVLTNNRSWARMIKSLFPVHKIDTHIVFNKSNAAEILNQFKVDTVLMDDSFKTSGIAHFANNVHRTRPKAKFYLYSSDISLLNTLKEETAIDINMFVAPVNPGEVQRKIISDMFPRKKKQVMYNVDLNLLKTFIVSTNEVMEEMAGIEEMTNFSPFIMGTVNKKIEEISIRGTLVLDSKHFKGTFFISFPKTTFLNIYEKMLGEKELEISDEIRDMGAEFANIIYGKAKRILNSEGYDLGMVIPGVDSGEHIKSKFDVIVIPMFTELGNFYIKVAPNYIKSD